MSHLKERTEKNCLNCETTVTGRFCQQCGQENVVVKESFGHLIMHFIEDLTHFDGKLWVTLKLLLFKPAKLTQHYMDGKRATYIHPIRMYLFISAVFFFFIFSGNSSEFPKGIEIKKDSTAAFVNKTKSKEAFNLNLSKDSIQFNSTAEYDSAQSKLSLSKKDNWIESTLVKKSIEINNKYKDDNSKIGEALLEQFQHYFSRILYISLPLFALFLWVLYRRNKNHYFVDHLIFSIHIYCAFFIILFAAKLFNILTDFIFHKTYGLVDAITIVALFYYLYKALKNHFRQSTKKTILKFFILNALTMFLMLVLIFAFFLLSLFNI
jgi:hypothetical protein